VTQHTGPPIARDEIVPATPSESHSLLAFSGLSFKPPAYLQRAVLRRTRSWLWNEQSANNSPPNQWNYPLTSPFLAVFERIPRTDETCNLVCQPPRTVFLFFLLPCSENPIEPNIAGFSDRLWSQMSTLVNSRCSTNRISDCSEERGSRALQHPYTVCVHFGTEVHHPFCAQLIDPRPESLDCVMHVKDVFRALVAIASPMDKYFLCEETGRICNLHSGVICEREAIGRWLEPRLGIAADSCRLLRGNPTLRNCVCRF
jgi:hypothetical protein